MLEAKHGQRWQWTFRLERFAPELNFVSKNCQLESEVELWIWREIADSPLQQRPAADEIPLRMMVKGDSDLDQTLQKLTLRFGCPAPDILQRLMGFKELGAVKKPDAVMKLIFQRVLERL